MAGRSLFKSNKPRKVNASFAWSSTVLVYCLNWLVSLLAVECCSKRITVGLNKWRSPSLRHEYSPPVGNKFSTAIRLASGKPSRWRNTASCAIWSKLKPWIRLTVPVKYSSITSELIPRASKICAPKYDWSVEMPILEKVFNKPLPTALVYLSVICSFVNLLSNTPSSRKPNILSRAK